MSNQLRDIKPVAVLGCGPAGLLAAHAVGLTGQPMAVFSIKKKSVLGGAQFLHSPIPGLTAEEPDFHITYQTRGDAMTYRHKVYGSDDPTTNPPFVSMDGIQDGQTQAAWNLAGVYDQLWDAFEGSINDEAISPQWLLDHGDQFRAVVSTMPLPMLCKARAGLVEANHSFTYQGIRVAQGDDAGAAQSLPDNTVAYDGDLDHVWYRASKINGVCGVEYSDRNPLPPIPNLVPLQKPIQTTCDCWPDVLKVGRMGMWKKGILTHHAFEDTVRHFMAGD